VFLGGGGRDIFRAGARGRDPGDDAVRVGTPGRPVFCVFFCGSVFSCVLGLALWAGAFFWQGRGAGLAVGRLRGWPGSPPEEG